MIARHFLLFLTVGGLAAGLNYFSRFLFSLYFPFWLAVILSFFVGIISGYVMMRRFVFHATDRPIVGQSLRYLLVNGIALLQTLVISLFLAKWLLPQMSVEPHAEALGHLVGVLVPVVTSYFGHKLFTFR